MPNFDVSFDDLPTPPRSGFDAVTFDDLQPPGPVVAAPLREISGAPLPISTPPRSLYDVESGELGAQGAPQPAPVPAPQAPQQFGPPSPPTPTIGDQLTSGVEGNIIQPTQMVMGSDAYHRLQQFDRVSQGLDPVEAPSRAGRGMVGGTIGAQDRDPYGLLNMTPEQRTRFRDQALQDWGQRMTQLFASQTRQRAIPRTHAADETIQLLDQMRWGDAWRLFSSQPGAILQQILVENAPNAALGMAISAPFTIFGGRVLGAMASFASEYGMEFGPQLQQELFKMLGERHVDVSNADAMLAAMRADPTIMQEAGRRAGVFAFGPAIMGAVTTGGGRGYQPGRGALRNTGNIAAELAIEPAGEMAGQALGDAASQGEFNPGQILAEGVGAAGQSGPMLAVQTAREIYQGQGQPPGGAPPGGAPPGGSPPGGAAGPIAPPGPLPGQQAPPSAPLAPPGPLPGQQAPPEPNMAPPGPLPGQQAPGDPTIAAPGVAPPPGAVPVPDATPPSFGPPGTPAPPSVRDLSGLSEPPPGAANENVPPGAAPAAAAGGAQAPATAANQNLPLTSGSGWQTGSPAGQAPPVVGTFTTAKGSTYELHADGSTSRNKAARPEHPGDQGPQERSARTVYVTPENANRLAVPASNWRVVDGKNGTMSVTTQNLQTGVWGRAPSQSEVPVSTKPQVGLMPLELWKPEVNQGWTGYRKVHFGNPIRTISSTKAAVTPKAPRGERPAAPPTTPPTAPPAPPASQQSTGTGPTLADARNLTGGDHTAVIRAMKEVTGRKSPTWGGLTPVERQGVIDKLRGPVAPPTAGEKPAELTPEQRAAAEDAMRKRQETEASARAAAEEEARLKQEMENEVTTEPAAGLQPTEPGAPGQGDQTGERPAAAAEPTGEPSGEPAVDTGTGKAPEALPPGDGDSGGRGPTAAPPAGPGPAAHPDEDQLGERTPPPGAKATDTGRGGVERPADWGSKNKLITTEEYEKDRKALRDLFNTTLSSGVNPEILIRGARIALYHIEAGARKFADFARLTIADLGEGARPFLDMWYEGARRYPGFDNTGMSTTAEVEAELKRMKEPAAAPAADTGDAVQKLRDRTIMFASGMSRLKDFQPGGSVRGGDKTHGIGVDIGEVSASTLKEIAQHVVDWKLRLFVDSGAFSLFRRKQGVREGVDALDFDTILKRYDELLRRISGEDYKQGIDFDDDTRTPEQMAEDYYGTHHGNVAEDPDVPAPLLVMPDVVGDQAASIELAKKYKDHIASYAFASIGSRPIVPIQRGELSLEAAYDQLVKILGTDNFIVGIPANEKAIPHANLVQFLKTAKPKGVHFLGATAPKTLNPKLQAIVESGHTPEHISADANTLRSKLFGQGTGDRGADISDILRPPEQPEDEGTDAPGKLNKLADRIVLALQNGGSLDGKQLAVLAEKVYGGTRAEGAFTPKDLYDALELAINKHALAKKYDPNADLREARRIVQVFEELLTRVPTQTVRTVEQDTHQQFSTPPGYSYIVARIANIGANDVVLEPSAGTGSIVVHAMNANPSEVIANEIAPRRVESLKALGVDRVTTEDAVQLNNILPADIKPTVVVMNPPFSATAGRTQDKDTMTGARHIEAALDRLEPGGRLVAIVGQGMAFDAATFKAWWGKIRKNYAVRANIAVSGDVYKKYGTSFGTRVLVIDKVAPDATPAVVGEAETLYALLDSVEDLRNARTAPEQRPGEPSGEGVAAEGEGATGLPPGPRDGAGVVGGAQPGGGRGPGPVHTEPPGHDSGADAGVEAGKPDEVPVPPGGRPGELEGDAGAGTAGSGKPGGRGKAGPGVAGGEVADGKPGRVRPEDDAGVAAPEVKAAEEEAAKGELTEAIFEDYKPQRLEIPGSKAHPTPLVQSAAMATVQPPKPTYTPQIPESLITSGDLSLPQLESIVYAGQAHEEMLLAADPADTPRRRGFFIGDGTGVGKGRQLAGIILDNWNRGRKKAIWITKNASLLEDAVRDWTAMGQDESTVHELGKTKLGEKIKHPQGVLFATYSTLPKAKQGVATKGAARTGMAAFGVNSRIGQILDWVGPDFDGVLVFDESHMMSSALDQEGERGKKEASLQALVGVEIQKILPKARVVYASATGATEVNNLAYADRLGIWGRGKPFANARDFVTKVSQGGIAAMELIARDLKQLGAYIARNLSFAGVEQNKLEHALTEDQRKNYDTLAEAWQVVLQNIEAALAETAPTGEEASDGTPKVDGKVRGRALSVFWGANQRFFNQIITAMKMPSLIKSIERDIAEGRQAVVQLVNTDEAAQERAAAKAGTDAEALADLDITPRDILMQMVEKSFPVQQYEEQTDEEGNTKFGPVFDSEGKPVLNAKAVAMRDALLDRIASINVPRGALDQLIDHFGHEQVAEVTGRGRRFINKRDEDGNIRRMEDKRGKDVNIAETQAFQDGDKRVLVFSNAGGTGRSYHADNTSKSAGRRRAHYILQPGWRADQAVQGIGRTHRSNQRSAPIVHLVTTNLKAEKRFISSIARRISQLGALTKGQRTAADQGVFSARDNLESIEANDALRNFYAALHRGNIEGVSLEEYEQETGLKLADETTGALYSELPNMTKFLNRLLSLKIDTQEAVFNGFSDILDAVIDAREEAGQLDVGLETVKADRATKVQQTTVFTEPSSGAETKYVKLELQHKVQPRTFEQAMKRAGEQPKFVTSPTGKVYAVYKAPTRTEADGSLVEMYNLVDQNRANAGTRVPRERVDNAAHGYKEIDSIHEAEKAWNEAAEKLPAHRKEDMHLITGAVLPIWDRLGGHPRVVRIQTDKGERLLGRVIPRDQLRQTLERLGTTAANERFEAGDVAERVLEQGEVAQLANGWSLRRSGVGGENRIEIIGPSSFAEGEQLHKDGVIRERVQFKMRYFVPTGARGAEVLKNVIEHRPVVSVAAPGGGARAHAMGPERRVAPDITTRLSWRSRLTQRKAIRALKRTLARKAPTAKGHIADQVFTGRAEVYGASMGRVIAVALERAYDENGHHFTLNHEIIHFLRDQGFITEAEWAMLEKHARANGWVTKELRARYPHLSSSDLIEEAIANAHARWAQGRPSEKTGLTAAVMRIFRRITEFFRGLRAELNTAGFNTPEDLFEGIERGEVGRREPEAAEAAVPLGDLNAAIDQGMRRQRRSGPREHRVWHGSPHDFDAFTTAKIGTGEGAQVYGWGMYFADRKAIGEHYRRTLTGRGKNFVELIDARPTDPVSGDLMRGTDTARYVLENISGNVGTEAEIYKRLVNDLRQMKLDNQAALAEYEAEVEEANDRGKEASQEALDSVIALGTAVKDYELAIEAVKSGRLRVRVDPKARGKLYQVDLAPKEADYLDWDRPVSEQSPHVLAALRAAGLVDEQSVADDTYTGEDLYKELSNSLGRNGTDPFGNTHDPYTGDPIRRPNDKAASLALAAAGIPGTRYLDAESRNVTAKDVATDKRLVAKWVTQVADAKAQQLRTGATIGRSNLPAGDTTVARAREAAQTAVDDAEKGLENARERLVKTRKALAEQTRNYVIFEDKSVTIEAKSHSRPPGAPGTRTPVPPGPPRVGPVRRGAKWMAQGLADLYKSIIPTAVDEALSSAVISGRDWFAPMAGGKDHARAAAKRAADQIRWVSRQVQFIAEDWNKRLTPTENENVFNAIDQAHVDYVTGTNMSGAALDVLTPEERAVADASITMAQDQWDRARDVGTVPDVDAPSPYYAHRELMRELPDGTWKELPREGKVARDIDDFVNSRFSTKGTNRRKHLTIEDTERAAQAKFGDTSIKVRRTVTANLLAFERMELAIAAKTLVNTIEDYGRRMDIETVTEDDDPASRGEFFKLDHPAFYRFRPQFSRNRATGKVEAVRDANGDIKFERVPIKISKDFEGPLRAILTKPNQQGWYKALMALKYAGVRMVMWSPLMHAQLEWGRTMPLLPGKTLTGRILSDGARGLADMAMVRRAYLAGLVPPGHKGFKFDITNEVPGVSLDTSKGLLTRSWQALGNKINASVGSMLGTASEKTGDWLVRKPQEWLWDSFIPRLQMGIFMSMREQFMAKGMPEGMADLYAAHEANRYAGALPREAMSEKYRNLANLLWFSRTLTHGNWGVAKDVFTGAPRDVRAIVKEQWGPDWEQYASALAANKALRSLVGEMTLKVLANALLQHIAMAIGVGAIGAGAGGAFLGRRFGVPGMVIGAAAGIAISGLLAGTDPEDELNRITRGYYRRWRALMRDIGNNPWHAINPFAWTEGLGPNAENDPNKHGRVMIGYDHTGTAIYSTNPVGRIGEDFERYMTEFWETLGDKVSQFAKAGYQQIWNVDRFGRPLRAPDGFWPSVGRSIQSLVDNFLPTAPFNAARDLVTGGGRDDTRTNVERLIGAPLGLSVSRGAPGGPSAGEVRERRQTQEELRTVLMPRIVQELEQGNVDEARDMMDRAGLSRNQQRRLRAVHRPEYGPGGRPGSAYETRGARDYRRSLSPDEQQRFDEDRARARARSQPAAPPP